MEGDGRAIGISGWKGGGRGAPRRSADPRAVRGIGNSGERSVSCSTHFRIPRLPRIPTPYAALCLSKMGGPAMAARAPGTEMGSSARAERVSDAAGRPAAGADVARSAVTRFLQDRSGVTAIEYGLLVALMTLAIIGAIQTLGAQALTQLFNKIASSLS